jgi:hypothetical protein
MSSKNNESTTNLLSASKRVMELAAQRRQRMAKRAAVQASTAKTEAKAEVKAKTVKATSPANGGFEGAPLSNAPDIADALGEEGLGYHVPPEVADVVEEAGSEPDATFQPGILIPPGLEDVVMAVADPATFEGKETRYDLIPFAPETATSAAEILHAGAHWILCANGNPLAQITLRDQENAEKIAAHFVSADYARSIMSGIESHGLKKTMEAVKAKPYVAVVDTAKKTKELSAKLSASSEETLREKLAGIKANYVDNLDLVLEASANNFIVENPLKDSLISAMATLGIPSNTAAEMVDNAFFAQGAATFMQLLNKADEWSKLTADARHEIVSALHAAGRRSRPMANPTSHAFTNPNYDQGLAQRMASAAIPVAAPVSALNSVSVSAHVGVPAGSGKDEYRRKFGRFGSL